MARYLAEDLFGGGAEMGLNSTDVKRASMVNQDLVKRVTSFPAVMGSFQYGQRFVHLAKRRVAVCPFTYFSSFTHSVTCFPKPVTQSRSTRS